MKLNCFFILIVSMLFVSCNNNVDDKLEKEIIRTLEQNNEQLKEEYRIMYDDLDYKLRRAETENRAYIYLKIAGKADSIFRLFDSTLSNTKINSEKLKNLLSSYIQSMYNIDTNFINHFRYTSSKKVDTYKNFIDKFSVKHIGNSIILNTALTINKVQLLRNQFLKWCLGNTMGCDLVTYSIQAIASQNSTILKTNDKLQILAGVGIFNRNVKSTITIDEDTIKTNNEGVADYKINVGNKKGKFKKKVTISYIRPNGEKINIEKEIIYTVK